MGYLVRLLAVLQVNDPLTPAFRVAQQVILGVLEDRRRARRGERRRREPPGGLQQVQRTVRRQPSPVRLRGRQHGRASLRLSAVLLRRYGQLRDNRLQHPIAGPAALPGRLRQLPAGHRAASLEERAQLAHAQLPPPAHLRAAPAATVLGFSGLHGESEGASAAAAVGAAKGAAGRAAQAKSPEQRSARATALPGTSAPVSRRLKRARAVAAWPARAPSGRSRRPLTHHPWESARVA